MAATARSSRGLPIAAYLALLVVLALTSAFVAVMAIVLWLPPRPPDVMRADMVSEHFKLGYDHMRIHGRLIEDAGMSWHVQADAPRQVHLPQMHPTQHMLAGRLDLQPDQVRIAAAQIQRNDVFVFRVRDAEEMARDARREVERLRREGRLEQRQVIVRPSGEDGEIETRVGHVIDEHGFEIRVPQPLPEPDAAPAPRRSGGVRVAAPAPPAPPTPPVARVPVFAPAPPGVILISGFEIGAQLPDGRWLVMRQGRNWAELSWIGRATLVIGGTLLVLSLLAMWFARRLTRPIRNFSEAVQAVGVDPQSEPVREEGPRELRGAARAVNTMQARLRALIADRTKTLAAVAHDMRTPLMRLRLTAENAASEQREKMAKEIEEVEALVASFIAFARDDPAEEARVRLDLSALLQSTADDHAEAGRNVSFAGEDRVVITGQSLGLKRLFSNLVDNALKYGASARIKLRREENAVIVDVEDDGPGIPADQRESVFEPFVRLNAEGTRGAGLGLAAARSIARAHGGDIVILDAEHGALLRVTLPG
ncbi:MAG TPA: ATP-binding protein [Candidatus Binatia bacterium]|nr:ATP-binding protein [Candidatus Binatia bacterium]